MWGADALPWNDKVLTSFLIGNNAIRNLSNSLGRQKIVFEILRVNSQNNCNMLYVSLYCIPDTQYIGTGKR